MAVIEGCLIGSEVNDPEVKMDRVVGIGGVSAFSSGVDLACSQEDDQPIGETPKNQFSSVSIPKQQQ